MALENDQTGFPNSEFQSVYTIPVIYAAASLLLPNSATPVTIFTPID